MIQPETKTINQDLSVRTTRVRLLPRVLIVGLFAGGIAVAFRLAVAGVEGLRSSLIDHVGTGVSGFFIIWASVALATAVAILLVRKFSPAAGGSGIPHIKAVLLHQRRFFPIPVILVKFVGGVLSIGSGLALGREGPTIQMGGAAGKIVGRLFGMTQDERFILIAAGGGVQGGTGHGATDELGFHAIEDRHYVTDLHATVLNQLGLDPRKLQYPGRKRLEMDYGEVIHGIL